MNFSQLQGERYKRLPIGAQIISDCKVTHLLMLSMFSVLISDFQILSVVFGLQTANKVLAFD